MRRSEKEIKDRAELESVLEKGDVLRLGLYDGNEPYVVPVNYGYLGNCIYFHSATAGRKLEIIRRNNRICFEVDTDRELVKSGAPCKWGMKYRSVIGYGWAFFVDVAGKAAALKTIVRHYSDVPCDFSEDEMRNVAIIRIEIESMTGKKSGY